LARASPIFAINALEPQLQSRQYLSAIGGELAPQPKFLFPSTTTLTPRSASTRGRERPVSAAADNNDVRF